MKRGGPTHPKTLDLAAYLRIDRWGAVGILECLFHFVATYARRGDIGRLSDRQIAQGVGWGGDPEQLIEGLVAAGWLDRCCDEHRLRVHDWHEHADQGVNQSKVIRDQKFLPCYLINTGKPSAHPEPTLGLGPTVNGTGQTATLSVKAEKNPLVNRGAMIAEAHELVSFIAPLEGLDPTEVIRKATEFNGRSYVNLHNVASDDRIAHSVAKLKEWARKLKGAREPAPPMANAPPQRQSVDAKNTDAIKRAIERRQADAGRGAGDRVSEGVVTDRKSLPPGS